MASSRLRTELSKRWSSTKSRRRLRWACILCYKTAGPSLIERCVNGHSTVPERVERLVWEDAKVGSLAKADDAEVYGFVRQAFMDSPDYFVRPALLRIDRHG